MSENIDIKFDFEDLLMIEDTDRDSFRVKKLYVDIAENLNAGILLGQIIFWYLPNRDTGKTKLRVEKDGHKWIAKQRDEWWDEIRFTPRQFDRAANKLIKQGIIKKEHFKFNGEKTIHLRLDIDKFVELANKELQKRKDKIAENADNDRDLPNGDSELPNGKTDSPNGETDLPDGKTDLPNGDSGSPDGNMALPDGETGVTKSVTPLTESTTENTTERTSDITTESTTDSSSTTFSNLELKSIKNFYKEVTERKLKSHLLEEIYKITDNADYVIDAIKRASLNNNTTGTPSAQYILSILKNLEDEQNEDYKYDSEADKLEAQGWA